MFSDPASRPALALPAATGAPLRVGMIGIGTVGIGTWRVLLVSGLVYALGLFLMSLGTSPLWLHVGGGVLVGLGVGAGSFGILLSGLSKSYRNSWKSFL